MSLNFDNSYFRDLPGFYAPANPSAATDPELVVWNGTLAERLGLAELEDGAAELISGFRLPGGADPIAQAYSGHQFGHFSPQLGDGRAILLGEHITPNGARFDLQLKGSGRTAFSRGGDGRYALGPALRDRGLLFVGIDVIDGNLTEINVTSPTGIRAIARLGGPDVAAKIWDTIERKRGAK